MELVEKNKVIIVELPKKTREVQEIRPRGDSYVRIGGNDYAIRGWTPHGFHAAPYSGALVQQQFADVALVLRDYHDPDGELRIEDRVFIERIDESGLHARWWWLPERKKSEIAAYFEKKTKN